jgi:CBS domain-containing protein
MSSDPYVYPGTTVLKNIPGIRNQEVLDRFEGDRVGQRSLELLECPLFGPSDIEHLRGIHRYLFQDVYEWAGEFRTVDIAKGNSYFAHVPYIESTLKDQFERLSKGQPLRDLALRIVAAGCDPNSTCARDVMTREVFFCRPEDDLQKALELMERRQVGRIPIVDRQNRIVGIIAQADIATRLKNPQTISEVIEVISTPRTMAA